MKKTLTRIGLILAIIAVVAGIGFTIYGIYKKATLNIPNLVLIYVHLEKLLLFR